MLNPVECFIEGIQTNQEVLVQEVQQFLEFGQILQQDQKKILNDPIVLLSYAYQLEEYLGKQKQQVTEKILNVLQVQLVLFSKFVQLNRSDLSEYYYIFEVLQKKMKLLRFQSTNEDILALSLDASRVLFEQIDQKKLNALSLMLYHINVHEYDEEDDIEVFYERLVQFKDKRQKLLNQENLLTYALNLLIQKCYRRVLNAEKIDVVLKVCLHLREFKQFNNQLNLCIMLAYYKMNMIEDFIEYCKTLDQKTLSIEIQILHLVVRCQQLVKNESDSEKQKDIHQRMCTQFMELNLIHQVSDILMICKELASNLDTYILAIRTITIWLQYKYILIQKSTNAQNISKTVNDVNDLLEQCSSVLDHSFEEFKLIANMVICQLLDLTSIVIQIVGHFKKLYKISSNQFISFVVAQISKFNHFQDKHIQHSAGKLISLLSTSQLEATQNIQALSIYLNMEFRQLPQTQSILFQQILKNYQGGFVTAVLLFIREFKNNQQPNDRMNLCNQLRNLLEEANKIFESNPIPMYALFEASLQVECTYHIQTAMEFIMKQEFNQELLQFTLKLMQKSDNNSEQIFNTINKYLTSKTQDQGILQEIFHLSLQKPKRPEKSLCSLYCYFMMQMEVDTCSLLFIKETIMGNNQFKYQWKSENNKSIFLFLVEICEQQESLEKPRIILELLFYLIDTNTREEVNQLIPYVLRLVIKMNLEEYSLQALQQSIKYENLFSLLIVEVSQQKLCKQILKKFIYEISIPSMAYFQVLSHLIEMSQTIDEVSELLPQLNQILRTTIIDETLAPYAQILYLKLNSLHEYVPLGRIDMFSQSLNLLQTKL